MAGSPYSPEQVTSWLEAGWPLFLGVHAIGIGCFLYIVIRRLEPLVRAQRDPRFDRPLARLGNVLQYWLGQWRHPRYPLAGAIHVAIFACFLMLAVRAFSVLLVGVSPAFSISGPFGHSYEFVTDYAATLVFLCMIVAALRRIVFRPARYEVPASYGKGHAADAIFLLGLIALLMVADSLFEAGKVAAEIRLGEAARSLAPYSLPWIFHQALGPASLAALRNVYVGAYLLHAVTFYFLLCYRPFGIQFHVETSLFTVFFAKLTKGTLKPVRWGVADKDLEQVRSFGVKHFEDFTWKHILDFYSCADCGRCSDNCPANAVGRPLSPRFISIKARDYAFEHFPVFGRSHNNAALIGTIYSADEIWSCTTCGACEQECPLLVEYIDKIVDMRRGMVDDGNVPQTLQKPLQALESRGNPYGKIEKKRADWTKNKALEADCKVNVLTGAAAAETLYFVDSITSYDDRMQSIARATAKILTHVGEDFGILGAAEKDSGHEVRRFGEETLFQELREQNVEAIETAAVKKIITNDPHAFNALKHDYNDLPPVEHISQVMARAVKAGSLRFRPEDDSAKVYAYHDPCYLGRHNDVYDDPRTVLDAIPGLKRVEMARSRDRSFCCGGGGLMLFYEPKEEERMGVRRVRMAADAGANVIVTACPFCLANIEDAIKVAGLEGKMTAIDLAELAESHIARETAPAA